MSVLIPLADALFDADVFTDGDWVETKDQDPNGDVRLTQLADVGDGRWINKSARFITSEKATQLKCTYLRPGDLLVARMPDPLGRCCVFPGDSMRCVTVVDVCVIRPNRSRVDNRYLMHVINTPHGRRNILRHTAGTTRQRISRKNLGKVEIPMPPLAKQRRVAEILDAADALRAKRREAIVQLDTLVHSTFLDMFGDPVTDPMGWGMATIGEVTTCLDRLRQPVKKADRIDGAVPYYGANGQQGWIHEALFDEPLVLVAEDGGHFGDPARGVAYRIDGPSWVNNHAHVLRPAKTIDVEYLHRALRHYDFGPYINGSTRAKLNQAQLNRARLVLPPLHLQHRFAAIVQSAEQQRAHHHAHLAELDSLFASLQSRAFRGGL